MFPRYFERPKCSASGRVTLWVISLDLYRIGNTMTGAHMPSRIDGIRAPIGNRPVRMTGRFKTMDLFSKGRPRSYTVLA